jgi:hypothetical protein
MKKKWFYKLKIEFDSKTCEKINLFYFSNHIYEISLQ